MGAVMERIYAIASSTGFVFATHSLAIVADLPPRPANQGAISFHCVARTSLGDAIKQRSPCYFFQLRMACNRAWKWMVTSFEPAFDRNNSKSDRPAQDRWFHFISLVAARRHIAVMTKETAGMFALEISPP
jgi:hypothetical protein